MIMPVLAAVVAAGAEPQTLAGVTLGSNVRQVLAEHPGAQQSVNGLSRWWRWNRPGGGAIIVTADDTGKITRVDFQADQGQADNIDLPCVGAFPVRGSDAKLNSALAKTACSAFNGADYGLPDRSLVDIRFGGPGNGQVAEATWYRPFSENGVPVGQMHSFIDYLRRSLTYAGGVARIYYAGECPTQNPTDLVRQIRFPSVWFQPPQPGAVGIDAIRQIVRDDPNVVVMQDRSGMLRITIGIVSNALLRSRIQSLTLAPFEQYTALSAVEAIAMTANDYAKQRGLPYTNGQRIVDHLVQEPIKGLPHLPTTMQNLTIDEMLDVVARTFKGIATYGVCEQPDGKNLFWLGFIYNS